MKFNYFSLMVLVSLTRTRRSHYYSTPHRVFFLSFDTHVHTRLTHLLCTGSFLDQISPFFRKSTFKIFLLGQHGVFPCFSFNKIIIFATDLSRRSYDRPLAPPQLLGTRNSLFKFDSDLSVVSHTWLAHFYWPILISRCFRESPVVNFSQTRGILPRFFPHISVDLFNSHGQGLLYGRQLASPYNSTMWAMWAM